MDGVKSTPSGFERGIVSHEAMVLIVDDHVDSCMALKRLLEHKGVEARCVFGAQDALRFLHESKADVVVLDDMMPDGSGLDVLTALRKDASLADVKVVFYSAVFDDDRMRQAMRLGVKDWMVKGTMQMSQIVDRIAAVAQA
jgi:PleD family two-component response regulator